MLLLLAIAILSSVSCSSGGGGYPEIKVTTAEGRPGVCHNCQQAIPVVHSDNLLKIQAAQYITCGEKCSEALRQWHREQFGK
ncbi:MAG: hypothetical protein IT427_15000 [Pirellulales bacterium]|nr:hypothetical protein [Pirellulales bacterium]